METSHVVAAILMLVSPAILAVGYQLYQPERAVGSDGSKIRRLHISLWSLTIACVGIWAGLAAGRPDPWLAGWSNVSAELVSGGRVEQIVWLLSFPLWFGVVMRFLVLSRPDPLPANPAGRVQRSARLTPRQVVSPVSDASWQFLWGIMGFAVVAVAAAAVWRNDGDTALSFPGAALLLVLTLVPLMLARAAVRLALSEPEPMDARDSQALSDLYAVHRVTKVWGLYWILLGLVTLLSCAAVSGVWAASTAATLGAVVGIGGSAVGTGGAVFGIYMTKQRARITGFLDKMVAS